mgnify:CR=1 FL=1
MKEVPNALMFPGEPFACQAGGTALTTAITIPRARWPMLHGKKVKLRPIEQRDYIFLFQWFHDRDLYLATLRDIGTLPTIQEILKWLHSLDPGNDLSLAWMIEAEGKAVGFAMLENVNWRFRKAGPSAYYIAPAERHKGYGRDAEQTVLRYAFDHLNLFRVWTEVTQCRAQQLLPAVYHKLEGRLRAHCMVNGFPVDCDIWGTLASDPEWQEYWETP